MAKIETLVDSFAGSPDTTLWTYVSGATNSGGSLVITPVDWGDIKGIRSNASYDLTDSHIIFDLNAFPTMSTSPAHDGQITIELTTAGDFSTNTNTLYYQLYIGPGGAPPYSPQARYVTAGAGTYVGEGAHRYLRISHSGTTVTWDGSNDLDTWTLHGTAPTSLLPTLTALFVRVRVDGLGTGSYGMPIIGATAGTPSVPTLDPADTFTIQDTTKWTWHGSAGVASGNLELAPTTYNTVPLSNGIVSNGVIDLSATPIYINLVGYPTSIVASTFATLYLALSTSSTDIANALTFEVPMGSPTTEDYEAHTYIGAAGSANYLWGLPDWFRITRDSTTIYWQGSPDGINWTTVHSVAASTFTPGTTALYVHMYARGEPTNTGTFKINSINTSPGSPAVSGISDTFTTKDLTKWTWQGTAGVNANNLEIIPNSMTTATLNWIHSNSTIDLDSEDFLVEVAGYPTTSPTGFISLYLILSTSATVQGSAPSNALLFRITTNTTDNNNSQVEYFAAGVQTVAAYPYTSDRWFRIKKVGSNVLWQTSANGDTSGVWTTHATVPTSSLPATTALYAHIGAYGDPLNTTPYKVGSVNTPPGTVAPVAPGPVQSFSASPGEQLLNLGWTAPASNGGSAITAYVIQQTSPAGPAAVNLGPTTTTYQATGLTAGVNYTFSIFAKNVAGNGNAVTTSGTPTAPAAVLVPGVPTAVTATAGSAAASVSWTTPGTTNGTITGYRIVDHNGTTVHTTTGVGTSANVTGLVNGVAYTFRVYASNANGEGLASAPSNSVTPFASGSASSALKLRASFGAYPGSSGYAALESSVGRVMQPVAYTYRLGDPFPSAEIATIARRDRSALMMLDTSGMAMTSFLNGNRDAAITALGEAIDATNRYVYVCPFGSPNDWTKPWSPYYSSASPGYDASLATGTLSMADLNTAFRNIARILRAITPYARVVWAVSVEPQPTSAADQWASFHPGPAADVVMMVGRNYAVGPAQGIPGQTSWKTPSQIFDSPYTALDAVTAIQTPFWLWTACHDPSVAFNPPSSLGFPPGSSVPVDSTNSKATWIGLLMNSTSWPRTNAVVWENSSGARNWPITSSTASNTAMRSHLADPDGWARSEIQHDRLGDHVRGLVSGLAKWARSGAEPAEDTNLYDRPDTRTGVRASIVYSTPYSQGPKTTYPAGINATDMLAWNKLHGLILRQIARYGMQGWAYASGAMPRDHSALMYPGTTTQSSGLNYVSLTTEYDALPGPTMQQEAGMVDAFAGSAAPITSTAPTFVFTTINPNDVTITFTPPSGVPSSSIDGYSFTCYNPLDPIGAAPGNFNPEWDSGLVVPTGSTYNFSNLKADTTYTFGVAAHTASGYGDRLRKAQKTAANPVVPPPTGSGLPTKATGTYHEYYAPRIRIIDLPHTGSNAYNVIYLFHATPTNGKGSLDGAISYNWPSNVSQATHVADVATCRARGQRVIVTLGGANAHFSLGSTAAVTKFVADYKAIYTALGGIDGVDLNNFESDTDPRNTNFWISALTQLKSFYAQTGANFIVTAPPGAWESRADADGPHLAGLYNAGVMDCASPQFYDNGTATSSARIQQMLTYYNNFGIPYTNLGIGFKISPVDFNATQCADRWNTIEAAHPQIRMGFNFSVNGDPTESFATTTNPVILT